MKKLWLSAIAALFLVGCAPDRTLETLIPRNALAVVLVDHPALAVQALGPGGAVPWKALDTGKPWAGAALPSNPPGFLLAVALADQPYAWSELEQWARAQGGLTAMRVGTYALFSSPGQVPGFLDPDKRFDLSRARAGGDPVAVYVDISNVVKEAALPEALRPAFAVLPWAEKNLLGIRLGFAPKDGGLELRVATDWRAGAEAASAFRAWNVPSEPEYWSALLPTTNGLGAAASLPASVWEKGSALFTDPTLSRWWSSLAPLLGPKIAVATTLGTQGGWTAMIETRDPQGVRQAFRSLVAGGLLQRNFPAWALDVDTPLIYQDRPDAGGIRANVSLGPSEFQIAYGADRIVFAGGAGAAEALTRWKNAEEAEASWTSQAPQGATLLAAGGVDNMGAKAAVKVLSDGNVELRVWVDAAGVKTWEERLPQALLGWLSGAGGSALP